ncbi:M20/M25/M40 family metallo-hydrolase [Sphingomonas donggukensis]|uniref:M20/M25/M40 family metallo-hydrolase n=1 Tax=Sphingomonas donggukensis TaxID=2949093 RepID=A0ABY4TW88_9SPHN|nr:M20/M25/M40 family metallo-hydrolase [Sphingomonas donggukensis]URW76670.1 M20/M25/M40 family metallo-hydrolase [Sphingomonas donggukensis]
MPTPAPDDTIAAWASRFAPVEVVRMLLLLVTLAAAQAATADIAPVRNAATVRAALAELDRTHDATVAEIVELTQIPAPPFKEAARAAAYAAKFRAAGLRDVSIDAEGNVTGLRPGTDRAAKLVVLSAHLDTVFPEGTDVTVRREGTKLFAPGIGDDTRGLAVLLAYARAMDAAKVATRAPILFVGTVGEEGRGDLRGVRHLLTKGPYRGRVGAFFSMDGADPSRVTIGGVGSKRYRVTFKGPGGHSYGAFGIVNPAAAMAGAIAELYAVVPAKTPRTTYAASVVGGGTSVNAIPNSVFVDVDMRSEDGGELARLEQRFLAIVDRAVAAENVARSTRFGTVSAVREVIGDRPAGATPRTAPLVTTTAASVAAMGFTPDFNASSTDSNVAMNLGIPAVTIESGGQAGRAHAPDEWIDVAKPESVRGMSVGLLAVVAAAGLASR